MATFDGVANCCEVGGTRRSRVQREQAPPGSKIPDKARTRLSNPELEQAFHGAMVQIYERARSEAGYNATRFLQMLSEQGGLATARHLLDASVVSDGFTALWERGRLDLSVETHVLSPQFSSLFTESDRRIARERLRQYGLNEDES